jgi:putative DNA primase/helicase
MGQGTGEGEGFVKTMEAARGRWRGILEVLGVDGKHLNGKHGPCPICGGKDRFRMDDRNGDGTYFCSGCNDSAGNGLQLLQRLHGWDFKRAAKEVDAVVGNVEVSKQKEAQSDAQKKDNIKKVLASSFKLKPGDPAHTYLTRRCGPLDLADLADLRYHPALKHSSGGVHPCLLAIIRNADRTGASVHRTYLTMEGTKAAVDPVRMIMPGVVKGASIWLGHPSETVGIAEGIETALCAKAIHGLDYVCATISAGNMVEWVPPTQEPPINRIIIFGDNDTSFVGQAAAYIKAKQLHHLGYNVEVRIPMKAGTDWADVWRENHDSQDVHPATKTQ